MEDVKVLSINADFEKLFSKEMTTEVTSFDDLTKKIKDNTFKGSRNFAEFLNISKEFQGMTLEIKQKNMASMIIYIQKNAMKSEIVDKGMHTIDDITHALTKMNLVRGVNATDATKKIQLLGILYDNSVFKVNDSLFIDIAQAYINIVDHPANIRHFGASFYKNKMIRFMQSNFDLKTTDFQKQKLLHNPTVEAVKSVLTSMISAIKYGGQSGGNPEQDIKNKLINYINKYII